MCYVITMDLQGSTAIASRLRSCGFEVSENCNPYIRSAFATSGQLLDVTKGGCSCGIYSEREAPDEPAERRRLERRGWSKVKIDRAINQKKHARDRGGSPDFNLFFDVLRESVQSGGRFSIYVHAYSGSFTDEAVPIGKFQAVTLQELESNGRALPCDIVVQVENAC